MKDGEELMSLGAMTAHGGCKYTNIHIQYIISLGLVYNIVYEGAYTGFISCFGNL